MNRRSATSVAALSLALLLISQKDVNAGFVCAHDDGWRTLDGAAASATGPSDATPASDEARDRDSRQLAANAVLTARAGDGGGMSTSSTDVRTQSSSVGSVVPPVGLMGLQCRNWVWVEGHPRLPSARETAILDPPRFMAAG